MGSIAAEVVETGEKRDRRGRRMTPVARRGELVRAYQASGLTQAEFARREGLRYSTFAHWVLKASKAALAKGPVQFAEVRWPVAASEGPGLEVRLVDGMILRGRRAEELAALVRALRA
jgi:transposase-like protein